MTFRKLYPGRGRAHALPVAALALAVALVACSSGSDMTGNGNGGGNSSGTFMRAKLDGQSWTADQSPLTNVLHARPGEYLIMGLSQVGTRTTSIELDLYDIAGTGTYPLGVNPSVTGGSAVLADGGGGWNTPASGVAGQITITSLTATRIAATFQFTATSPTASPASRVITEGALDLPITVAGSPGNVAANAGGSFSATLGGVAWNAADISATTAGGNLYVFSRNNQRTIAIYVQNFTGAGTFAVSDAGLLRQITSLGPNGTATGTVCCWAKLGGNSGTITVSSATSSRVQGTFSGTLAPSPGTAATAPLVITNGRFDVGLP